MRVNTSQVLEVSLDLELQQRLSEHVNPTIDSHWSRKIKRGLIPTEALKKGGATENQNYEEYRKLIEFEGDCLNLVLHLLDTERGHNIHSLLVHYFGLGLGTAFAKAVEMCNNASLDVIGYDVSREGCARAKQEFERLLPETLIVRNNKIFQTDIEFASTEEFIDPKSSLLLVAPRILDVLETQSPGKFARTLRNIGKLLKFVRLLAIHPFPEDNPDAVWRDTTPHSLEELKQYLAEGLEAEVTTQRIGTVNFYGHIYTGLFIGNQ